MWDTAAHEAAFGHSSTDMTVGLEPETTSITAGDYEWPFLESHSSESAGEPAVLAVPADEPLTIPVAVANDGDAAGTYDVPYRPTARLSHTNTTGLLPAKRRLKRCRGHRRRPVSTRFASATNRSQLSSVHPRAWL